MSQQLLVAAARGDPAAITRLLAVGVDVNVANDDGVTALMLAAESGHTETAGLLLDKGADVNATTQKGGRRVGLNFFGVRVTPLPLPEITYHRAAKSTPRGSTIDAPTLTMDKEANTAPHPASQPQKPQRSSESSRQAAAQGEARGRAEGKAEGRTEGRIQVVLRMLKRGLLPPDEIAEYTGMSLDEVRQLAAAQAG